MNVATGPRKHFKIKFRKGFHIVYRVAKQLSKVLIRRRMPVSNIVYYPSVKDEKTLGDLVNRASWYLPASGCSTVKVKIPMDSKLLKTNTGLPAPPKSQCNYVKHNANVASVDYKRIRLSEFDSILIWDKKNILNPRLWPYLAKIEIIDPSYFHTVESATYQGLYNYTLKSKDKDYLNELSKKNFLELLEKVSGCKTGYVFGTGPSLDRAEEFDYSNGFCVVCNSIVKNKKLVQHIKPQLLVFADPVFHFSPCLYSAEFRRLAWEAINDLDCYVMVPANSLPLYLAHYPELKRKIIGMSIYYPDFKDKIMSWLLSKNKYNFPTKDKFFVYFSRNILTMFMLPVVSSVVNKIYIIGADGRKSNEKYFWQHSPSSQITDLMQTAFNTHPSFFRDRVYSDYYKEHCRFLEGLIEYGESLGKEYYILTPSYIPVLAKRQVVGGNNH